MGCTGEKTYEEAVRYEIRRYLNGFNLLNSTKKDITDFINQDLKKKSIALQNYQYIYREEDAKQTVEEYKSLIWEKFRVGYKPNEEIEIEEQKDNENEDKKINNKKKKKIKINENSESSEEEKKSEKDNNIDNKNKDNQIENNNIN